MKNAIFFTALLMCSLFWLPLHGQAEDVVLDDFEYAEDWEIEEMYRNSGWLGQGASFLASGAKDGSQCMELLLLYDGGAWGGAAVTSLDQEPFAFTPGQMFTLDIKGDAVKLAGDQAILVFQLRDAAGEVIRFLDYLGPKSPDWITIRMPYEAFEEGPYDANPDVPADRENLISWEFYIQGVGGNVVDPFEATVFLDNLIITDAPAPTEGDRMLDDFEYASDTAIKNFYVSTGWQGLGTPSLTSERMEGEHAMQLAMSFEGGAWASAGVAGQTVDPFAFSPTQKLSYYVKGDPANLTDEAVLIVLSFRDTTGEVVRYLDAVGPISADWTLIEIPYDALEESPWDSNPDTPADRGKLVSWEFSIQGVGPEPIPPFNATILLDEFKLTATGGEGTTYVVNKIATQEAPNVMDQQFDAIYTTAANAMSYWEDDTYAPVGSPYDKTRAYLLTDGTTLFCGMVIGDPDTSTLTTDTGFDTLTKWNVDSWEIVFAPNPDTIDGSDYIKFAGDSAGQWDDISPDTEGGAVWDAPSFQSNAYIMDANTWAAEFSVAVADIEWAITDYQSYGHIGIQVKNPGLNFAWPNRASFGKRNGLWDLSALNPEVPIGEWSLYQ